VTVPPFEAVALNLLLWEDVVPSYDFDANPTIEDLMAQQGKGPVDDIRVLHGDFWPEDEPIEDFLAALGDWRGHRKRDLARALPPGAPARRGTF
jgi:hypothetical protein